jgi:hypothetical protein
LTWLSRRLLQLPYASRSGLSERLLELGCVGFALKRDIEGDAGIASNGNLELDRLEPGVVEPYTHFVHGVRECGFRLLNAHDEGKIERHFDAPFVS